MRSELQARLAQDPIDATLIAMLTLLSASVLFVACANVAGLLTSRAPVRAREMALRLAVGAGRSRIIRQLITESFLIALIGGALGLGVGYAGVTVFRQIQLPTDLPIALTFEMDRRALGFSLIVALMSAILFGLAPAIRSSRADLSAVMKATDAAGLRPKTAMGTRDVGWRTSRDLGGLAGGSNDHVSRLPATTGNRTRLSTGSPAYHELRSKSGALHRAQSQQFFERLAERAREVPGVKSVTLSSSVPMATDGQSGATIVPEGFQFPEGKENVTVLGAMVDEFFFDTMRLTILKGRGFRATDSADAPKVAVVNEQLANHYWPNQDPLGKRFRLDNNNGPWVEIVGLAKTSKYIFLAEAPIEFLYMPYKQRPNPRLTMLVESLGDPASLVTPMREVVRGLDASMPIFNVRTMEEFYRLRTVSIFNIIIGLIAAMGVMGLALSIVGLYGLVAYGATRRTREIGIRMAIGADRPAVLRMVLRQGLILATVGLVVGLGFGLLARRGLAVAFPGGRADNTGFDFVAFILVALSVLAATIVAAYIPARRASRINPTEALRYE